MKKMVLLMLLPLSLMAQPRKDGRQLVALKVTGDPDKLNGENEYLLIVEKPKCVAPKPNQTFLLQNSWRETGDKVAKIGEGTIRDIYPTELYLHSYVKGGLPKRGDMAMFLVALKPAGRDSLFFKMARLGIMFTTVTDSNFYDRNKLLANAADYPTAKLLKAMVADIHYTAQEMAKMNDAQDQDITEGTYKDQKLFAMMGQATEKDVLNFMRYVYAKPEKYMMHDWKASETFATWVINGAP